MAAQPLKTGIAIVVSSLALGVVGDILLRSTPWGLNFAILVTATVAAVALVGRIVGRGSGISLWLSVPVVFAECFVWRDSPFLKAWGFMAVVAAFTLVALERREIRLPVSRMLDYAAGAIETGVNVGIGALLLAFGDIRWGDLTRRGSVKRVSSVAIGAMLAIPLLLTFGPLLAAADPVFAKVAESAFDWDFAKISSHLLLISFITWLCAGYLRGVFVANGTPSLSLQGARAPQFGIVEIGIALGALAFLFLLFVAVQARYLFGGEQIVHTTVGLGYADYARRGFFELVAVAALTVPVLLAADWILDRRADKDQQSFKALATVIVLLVTLIMISALVRMRLYVHAYGLTVDRFYATAFMLWIASVLGWFMVTVLRGARNRFAFGAVAGGFATLAVLNVLNPDAAIARSNLARAESGRALDVPYLLTLSADAAPTILAGLSSLPQPARCELEIGIRETRWATRVSDWRSWNLARSRARGVLERDLPSFDCEQHGAGPAS